MCSLQTSSFASLSQRQTRILLGLSAACLVAWFCGLAHAVDLVNLAAVGGPLVSALTTLGGLTPGVKAIAGFLAFLVAIISLIALRSFGPALTYVGVAVFGAVGLVVGGAILGAVI